MLNLLPEFAPFRKRKRFELYSFPDSERAVVRGSRGDEILTKASIIKCGKVS